MYSQARDSFADKGSIDSSKSVRRSSAIAPESSKPNTAWERDPELPIQRHSALLVSAATVLASAGLQGLPTEPEYTGQFQLATDSASTSKHLSPTNLDGDRHRIARQIQALHSPEFINPALQQLGDRYPDLTYETLTRDLEITYDSGAETLNVTYQDTDAQQVEDVLQAMADAYLDDGQTCQTPACTGTAFIETQLSQLNSRIDQIQTDLSTFEAHHHISDLQTQIDQLSSRIDRLSRQRISTETEMSGHNDLQTSLQKQFPITGASQLATELLTQVPHYNERLYQIRRLNRYLASELSRETPDQARLQAIQAHRQKLIQGLRVDIHLTIHDDIPPSSQPDTPKVLDSDRLDQLEMWIQTIHNLRIQRDYQQAIAQLEQPLTQHLVRRQTLVNYYAHLQRELRLANQTVNQYQAKLAELEPIAAQQRQSWQLVTAPQLLDEGTDSPTAIAQMRPGSITTALSHSLNWMGAGAIAR